MRHQISKISTETDSPGQYQDIVNCRSKLVVHKFWLLAGLWPVKRKRVRFPASTNFEDWQFGDPLTYSEGLSFGNDRQFML